MGTKESIHFNGIIGMGNEGFNCTEEEYMIRQFPKSPKPVGAQAAALVVYRDLLGTWLMSSSMDFKLASRSGLDSVTQIPAGRV